MTLPPTRLHFTVLVVLHTVSHTSLPAHTSISRLFWTCTLPFGSHVRLRLAFATLRCYTFVGCVERHSLLDVLHHTYSLRYTPHTPHHVTCCDCRYRYTARLIVVYTCLFPFTEFTRFAGDTVTLRFTRLLRAFYCPLLPHVYVRLHTICRYVPAFTPFTGYVHVAGTLCVTVSLPRYTFDILLHLRYTTPTAHVVVGAPHVLTPPYYAISLTTLPGWRCCCCVVVL